MRHCSLLLLPRPSSQVSFDDLTFAYGASLAQVLKDVSRISAANANAPKNEVSLDIAIAYSVSSYTRIQRFLGLMYRLSCVIATEISVDVQFGNDVDVRIMLIDDTYDNERYDLPNTGANPVRLAELARRKEAWDRIYSIETETGERLLQFFLQSCDPSLLDHVITRVRGNVVAPKENEGLLQQTSDARWNRHQSVAVGGTFDHLHAGHKLLLSMTALVLEPINRSDSSRKRQLTIGITGDDLLTKKKFSEVLESWEERQGFVKRFLLEFLAFSAPQNTLRTSKTMTDCQERGREVLDELDSGLQIRYKEIFDPFGPTVTDPQITALVVSGETRAGGKAVNDKRMDKGWQPLEIFEVDVVDAGKDEDGGDEGKEGFESKISSTEIRARIIRRKESTNAKT